jgi:hypothetical protein
LIRHKISIDISLPLMNLISRFETSDIFNSTIKMTEHF